MLSRDSRPRPPNSAAQPCPSPRRLLSSGPAPNPRPFRVKIRFIHNPRAGFNRKNPQLPAALRRFAAARGLDATVVSTEYPAHATALAREAVDAGCDLVAAVGGDGLMNEVAQALLHSPAALGLIPCGSGNGLARHLRVPLRLEAALDALLTGRPRAIDTGLANGRPFFCAMGVGFDAEVARSFNRRARRGLAAYLATAARVFFTRHPEPCSIQVGDEKVTAKALFISAANSDQYGNHAIIAPGARADDGLLDLVLLPSANWLSVLPLAVRLFNGTFDRGRGVRHWRGPRFVIERAAAGFMHTDGEVHETAARIEIHVLPASLRVIAPAPS